MSLQLRRAYEFFFLLISGELSFRWQLTRNQKIVESIVTMKNAIAEMMKNSNESTSFFLKPLNAFYSTVVKSKFSLK